MKRITKLFVGILAIGVILQVTWFVAMIINIPNLSQFLATTFPHGAQETIITATVVASCTLLFAICALLLIIFTRTTERDLTLKSKQGKMTISRKAIEKMVNQSASAESSLGNIRSSVKLHGNGKRARVYIEAVSLSDQDFQIKAQQLQNNVNDSLQKYLGVKSSTKVHIIPRNATSESLKVT